MGKLDLQDEDVVARLLTSRLDITCLVEAGERVPILFSTLDGLREWVDVEGLDATLLCQKSGVNALRVMGDYSFKKRRGTIMFVDFIWVRAGWDGYRKAMIERARDAGEEAAVCEYLHADHVVARCRIPDPQKAWVLLMEVPRFANSAFGSRVERHLPQLSLATQRYDLTGLELFKIYCEALPAEDTGSFGDSMKRVHDQFLLGRPSVAQMMVEMESSLEPFLSR
jgi:hypothetical protein